MAAKPDYAAYEESGRITKKIDYGSCEYLCHSPNGYGDIL